MTRALHLTLRLTCAAALAAGLFATAAQPARASDWPLFGHDPSRSGVDAGDFALSSRNAGALHERWRVRLGAVADSAPIYLSRVTIGGRPTPMLYVTARDGATYGIDARDGRIRWRFVTRGPKITNSMPAADGGTLYVPGVDGAVHALDPATGAERREHGFPVRITEMARTEKNASALNVANGYLYAVTSGYIGDAPPYVGHVVSIRLSDGSTHVFNALCSDGTALPTRDSCPQQRAGIWARAGAVVDPDPDPEMNGRVYAATGNGAFDANAGGHDYGDSLLALSADGAQLLGSYTPDDYDQLQVEDADLGSTAPALLPREEHSRTPLLAVQGGKDELLRLLDRAHLPGVGKELQEIELGDMLFSAPAVWRDPKSTTWVFVGLANELQAYRLVTDLHGTSRLVRAWSTAAGATSPVVSNGVVFAAVSGALHAYDAASGNELWNSTRPSVGGTIGAIHWQSPIVADGRLYCCDEDGMLTAYALPGGRASGR
ncbi:MAG: PQQ-binding-like beta-propeller repeat protein [Vulcanimicrobiaceae bacterium]